MREIVELVRQEALAEAFRARYGVTDVWEDQQIELALADHGYPSLAALPAEPRGQARVLFGVPDGYVPQTDTERHTWQRLNGMHLIGHVIAEHDDRRCSGCRDWGP